MVKLNINVNQDELLKAIDSQLNFIVDEVFANSQQNIVDKKIIDQGTLLKSGNITRDFLSKTITYSVPYADVMEFGRLPGTMPPVDQLVPWVLRKGLASNEKEARSIAWAIAKDIEINGMTPRPFLGPAVESVAARIKSR